MTTAVSPPAKGRFHTSDDTTNAAASASGPVTPSSTRALAPSSISDEQLADALARSNGSASRAAKILGVSRTTYYELRKRNPSFRSVTAIPDEERDHSVPRLVNVPAPYLIWPVLR